MHARVFDHSGIDIINTLAEKYKAEGKELHLKHLSQECYQFIIDSKEFLEVNIIEDPKYHVALNELG